MRKDDLHGMTRLELLEEAKRLEIRGRSTMSKEQLLEAVAATVRPKPGRATARPVPAADAPKATRKAREVGPSSPPEDAQPQGKPRTAEPHAGAPRPEPPSAPPRREAPGNPPPRAASRDEAPGNPPPPAPSRAETPGSRPAPRDEEDEDGQNWNSTALGRDPNYGRFLNPGSMPSRNPPAIRRGPGGPPSPIAKSLAERSELGRQRAGERSYSTREDLRRSGAMRRDSGYTQRYERDRRPVDPRSERGRGRAEEPPSRAPQGGRGPQDGGRGGRTPGGPTTDRRGPGEGRHERDDRHAPDRRGGSQGRPHPGPAASDEMRRRGPRDADGPVIEAPRQHGDSREGVRSTWSAEVPETRARVPESVPSPPPPPPRILDRCRLMVRDPYCVHAYWEVTEESVERLTTELAGEFAESQPILRVHGIPISGDPDEPPAGFFDVPLAADATSAYVDVPRPNRGYRVDVGVITTQGLFFPLASSNTVITPRDSASRDVTEAWAKPSAPGAPPAPVPSPVGDAGEPLVSGPSGEGESGPATGSIAPQALDRGRDPGPAGDSGAGLAVDRGAGGVSSLELAAVSGRGLAPAGPGIPPGPSGPEEEGASAASSQREPRPFHFVVHTELVVYGATEPGAAVTLQGAPVALRSDGSFSLRFQLPDGEQILRAVAVSRDGKVERVITPVVTRRTTEQEETKRDEG